MTSISMWENVRICINKPATAIAIDLLDMHIALYFTDNNFTNRMQFAMHLEFSISRNDCASQALP